MSSIEKSHNWKQTISKGGGGHRHRADPVTLPPSSHACLASPLLPHSNKHNGERALDTMLPVIENGENNQAPVQLLS